MGLYPDYDNKMFRICTRPKQDDGHNPTGYRLCVFYWPNNPHMSIALPRVDSRIPYCDWLFADMPRELVDFCRAGERAVRDPSYREDWPWRLIVSWMQEHLDDLPDDPDYKPFRVRSKLTFREAFIKFLDDIQQEHSNGEEAKYQASRDQSVS